MNNKILVTALLVSFTVMVKADPLPPPFIYNQGPASPLVASTNISAAERSAYALFEGVMQMAEARIVTTNCSLSSGSYDVFIFSDGSVNDPDYNFVVVDSPGSSFTLTATLNPWDSFWGQSMIINQKGAGTLKKIPLSNYYATVSFNAKGTVMEMDSNFNVIGNSGRFNALKSKVIKDFNLVSDNSTGIPYIIDWGTQSMSKLGFPVQQYWQRSKVIRDDGAAGQTVFVKDRITGPTSCRIVLDTHDFNNQDFFYQTGTLSISVSRPDSPVDEFNF
jgi:hypothetical protein